uniref:Uncharacterized protein n=1 Tax=Macaca fascicularis TaxID=9541 RepID=A0A7N9ID55_MACFA
MASEQDVRARLQRAGQEHLLRFWAELAPESRAALLAELALLEPEALREHCRRAAEACARPAARLGRAPAALPAERVGRASRSDPETRRRWEEEGRRGGRPWGPAGARAHGGGGNRGRARGTVILLRYFETCLASRVLAPESRSPSPRAGFP